MKTKALIYCRVSSERQVAEGNGLGSQEQRCRTYAQNKNYDVVAVFPDEGISGGLFERPAMRRLIEYLDKYPTEEFVIVFDDLSRFSRDMKVHLQLRAELNSRGAKLECLNFNFDDSEEGELVELIMTATNQYNRKSNKRQVVQKTKARLERGYWTFHAPFGLKFIKHPTHGRLLVANDPYSTIYKSAIEKYSDGILPTIDEAMNFVNAEYKKHGLSNRMSKSNAKRMLGEILYAGYIEFKKWGVPLSKAQHEGIISIETYRAVQDRLAGVSKPWKRKDYNLDFPLRPLVLCADCSTPMTGSTSTGRHGGKYSHYLCRNKKCQYAWKTIKKVDFEDEFKKFLINKKPLDDVLDLAKDVLLEQWQEKSEGHSLHVTNAQRTIEEVTGKIQSYVERVGRTQDEDLVAEYEAEIKRLRQKKNDLLGQALQTDHYNGKDFGTATEKVFATLKKPVSMWQSDEYNDKRTILLMYFDDKLQYDRNLGFGTAGLDYPIRLIAEIGKSKNLNVDDEGLEPPTSSV